MEKEMEEGPINLKMEEFMRVILKIQWNMDLEFIIFLMAIFIKVNLKMIYLMAKELIIIKMGLKMREIG